MTTAKEFFIGIKKHRFEALFIAGLAAVMLAVPVVAFAGQDPAEQPPTLDGPDGSAGPIGEVLDPELDTPSVEIPATPAEAAIPPPAPPESNVDEQTPGITIEGESEGDDPACCEVGESQETTVESERDAGGNSADRARPSVKSSAREDAEASSKHSAAAARSAKGVVKSSASATTKFAKTHSTRSVKSTHKSSSSKKVASASTSNTRVAGSRVTPALGSAYIVRRGDCLWLITKAALGNRVSIVRTNNGWQRIWRANASTIGGNPHLIFPGQVLRIPKEM